MKMKISHLIYTALLLAFIVIAGSCEKEPSEPNFIFVDSIPNEVFYWEGDKLNLEGLVVYVRWNNYQDSKQIPFEDFEKENITTEPAHGEILTSNITEVRIIDNSRGTKAETEITVEELNLSLKKTEKISETPFINPTACIVYEDILYVMTGVGVYTYDFSVNDWSIITSNGSSQYVLTSFIKDKTWWMISYGGSTWNVVGFNIDTKTYTNRKYLNEYNFAFQIGALFENDNLYIYDFSDYSNARQKLFKYDVDSEILTKISDVNGISHYNYTYVKNTITLNNKSYFLAGGRQFDLYSFDKTNEVFEKDLVISRRSSYHSDICVSYGDYIITGLGGSSSVGSDFVTYTDKWYDGTLTYYNTVTNQSGEIKNKFYEGRKSTLGFSYNNEIYLLGGIAIHDSMTRIDEVINRNLLEKLVLE
jgi:hypothetical protein